MNRRGFLKSIAALVGVTLSTNEVITLASKVYDIPPVKSPSISEMLMYRYTNTEIPGYNALLVQGSHSRINDIELIEGLLIRRGYKCRIIKPKELNQYNVLNSLEQLAQDAAEVQLPRTIVYYVGHGHDDLDRDGIALTMGNDNSERAGLTPKEFYKVAGKIIGKKALIFDSCHSGIFVDYLKLTSKKSISDYVAIASCPANTVSISTSFLWNCSVGALTYGFYNVLKSEIKDSIDLSSVKIISGTEEVRKNLKGMKVKIRDREYQISFDVQRVSDTCYSL